jgi:hypothetical protein
MSIGTVFPCTMRDVFVVIVVVIVVVMLQVPDKTIRIIFLCLCYAGRTELPCWFCSLVVVMTYLDFGVTYSVPPSIGANDNFHITASVLGVV